MNIKKIINNNKSIVVNIVGAFFVRGMSMLISLFTLPVYIEYFENQVVLGVWFTLLSVLNWVLMFDLGLGNGLRNKLPIALAENDSKKAQQYISSTYIATAFLILVLYVFGIMIIPHMPLNTFFNIESNIISQRVLLTSVKIVFTGIMIQLLFKLVTSILYAIQKSAVVNLLILLSNISILIFIQFLPNVSLEEKLISISWINIFAVNIPLISATIIIFATQLRKCRPVIKMFNRKYAMEILSVGSVLLWLQLVFMIISSTNEFLISYLTSPTAVVEYQIYYKIFNFMSSIFVLALVPIWSAVTKAKAEKNYFWIKKLYNLLLVMVGVAFLVELAFIPFLQQLINFWLGNSVVNVNISYALILVLSNVIFILHNVNTSIGNGMSYFKTQIIWMTFAAVVNIPLAYFFVNLTGSWIGVILANILSLLPYQIAGPIYLKKYINKMLGFNS